MTPEQIARLTLPKEQEDLPVPLILEILLVIYDFHFRFEPFNAAGAAYHLIGKNDSRDVIAIHQTDTRLFLFPADEPRKAVFMNSSFSLFLQCDDALERITRGWNEHSSTAKCIEEFTKVMTRIDPASLQSSDTFWGLILEEIRNQID